MDSIDVNNKQSDRQLSFNLAPAIIVALGGFFVIISMFFPHREFVGEIIDNLMIQNQPLILLCSLGAIVAILRYWKFGTKSSAYLAIGDGLCFLGWIIKDAYTDYLIPPFITKVGAGVWIAGVGCAIVLLGGLMMRFPHLSVISGFTRIRDEAAQNKAQTKTCPFCAETIKSEAIVCRYCHKDLPPAPLASTEKEEVSNDIIFVENGLWECKNCHIKMLLSGDLCSKCRNHKKDIAIKKESETL